MLSSYFDLRARREVEDRQCDERRDEQRREDQRRRQDAEIAEHRHQELMTLLVAVLNNGGNQSNGQSGLIRTLQQTIEDLRAENDRLRQQDGNGTSSS